MAATGRLRSSLGRAGRRDLGPAGEHLELGGRDAGADGAFAVAVCAPARSPDAIRPHSSIRQASPANGSSSAIGAASVRGLRVEALVQQRLGELDADLGAVRAGVRGLRGTGFSAAAIAPWLKKIVASTKRAAGVSSGTRASMSLATVSAGVPLRSSTDAYGRDHADHVRMLGDAPVEQLLGRLELAAAQRAASASEIRGR